MKQINFLLLGILFTGLMHAGAGTFFQEQRQFHTTENGLPASNITSLIVLDNGTVYAITADNLLYQKDGLWINEASVTNTRFLDVRGLGDQIQILYKKSEQIYIAILENHQVIANIEIDSKKFADARLLHANYMRNGNGIYSFDLSMKKFKLTKIIDADLDIHGLVASKPENMWIAAKEGLFRFNNEQELLLPVYPSEADKSWAPKNIAGIASANGTLWFASPQGVGSFDGENWTLYTGTEGLPYNKFTCVAAGGDGAVWFGTEKGAIRFDDEHWSYRQGQRWLPDDKVNDIAVDKNGNAWIATDKGISFIERTPLTLAEKAKFYEDEIDRYNRRTPYGYVLEANLAKAGDKSNVSNHDSDNDGLWTSMYGAGECYAWAATGDPLAKERADNVFEAMEFLGTVTQGGSHPAPEGYVARTILPTSGPNPNDGRIARDKETKKHNDGYWKIIDPRWPVSEDSVWYWKSDTSSDELDGHYYFYGLYYDLVAETEEEKARVRDHVRKLTDHLVLHDYQMVDHDGIPTH